MARARTSSQHRRRILPGFRLALAFTLLYFALLVLIPLGALVLRTTGMKWADFWSTISAPRALASYRLSFGAAAVAAAVNVVFGSIVAWVLVRYRFPAKKLLDAIVDLPFALPTAVAGIALTTLYAPNGWIGRCCAADSWVGTHLIPGGLNIAFTPLGIVVALTFIGLPFVVRTVQPVIEDLEAEIEEAAASLGARRWYAFRRVLLPELWPALITGFALAFARALGEYGSVVFIAGNLKMRTEITPLLIIIKLEQFDYGGATALAVVMLAASFTLLLLINLLQRWAGRRQLAFGD